jgi:hypothetical protein
VVLGVPFHDARAQSTTPSPMPATPTERAAPVRGVVRDGGRQPIAGATVLLVHRQNTANFGDVRQSSLLVRFGQLTPAVRGVVRDGGRQPIAGATVLLVSPAGARVAATTDAAGGFALAPSTRGRHALRVRALGYGAATRDVTVADAPVVVDVDLLRRVHGGERGRLIPRARRRVVGRRAPERA